MNRVEQILSQLDECTVLERQAIFSKLRREFRIHSLETDLSISAESILEAIHRTGGLTLRMLRGVIAEAAFESEIMNQLPHWKIDTPEGDLAYDFRVEDENGPVRIQVKLQRSKSGQPWLRNGLYVVETQKTRGGKLRGTNAKTRPYRFGEFDLLAVAMYPSTGSWANFMYTVADWLMPDPDDPNVISKMQAVPLAANEEWTDCFDIAVQWLRSGAKKSIHRLPIRASKKKTSRSRRGKKRK